MLILPPGHAAALRARRGLSTREKWILGIVLATVAAVVVAVVISIGTAEHTTGNGCIDVKFPIVIGGQEIYACGSRARELCSSSGGARGANSVSDRAIAAQCRKAGLPRGA